MIEGLKRRQELADFLKTRRARLRPEQFGLADFPKRRVRGLRREEVAQLAGVGVSWYTWLEQGRDIHVSDQVLDSLVRSLKLNAEESLHLYALARAISPSLKMPDNLHPLDLERYQAILDGLHYPAHMIDRYLNVIAWNKSANQLFGGFENRTLFDRNVIRQVFMHPEPRQYLLNWEESARRSMAYLRVRSDQYAGDRYFADLIVELQLHSVEFRTWWAEHDILSSCNDLNEIKHPIVGKMTLQGTTLAVSEYQDVQIIVHTPLGDTIDKLQLLMSLSSSDS